MNLAFRMMGDENWYAGVVHLRNVIAALRLADPTARAEVLACPPAGWIQRTRLEALLGAPVRNTGSTAELYATLRERRYDAVFSSADALPDPLPPLPWIVFIFDFRHRRHPEQFPASVRARRDEQFARAAREAAAAALSSRECVEDFARYYPRQADKALLLPPHACPDGLLWRDPRRLARWYGLDRPYIHFPSQWWIHKNHETVIQALALVRAEPFYLLLTGNEDREYHTDRAGQIARAIAASPARAAIRTAGLIPYRQALNLMRPAAVVLQPSRFEGFGLTVSEAAALGKRLVLSDIPVHREHAAQRADYFFPEDARTLAGCLEAALTEPVPGFDPEAEAEALRLRRVMARESGERLLAAVEGLRVRRTWAPGRSRSAAGIEAETSAGLGTPGNDLAKTVEQAERHALAGDIREAAALLTPRLDEDTTGQVAPACYRLALQAGREGQQTLALELLTRLSGLRRLAPDLAAWVQYKRGEALALAGDAHGARTACLTALAIRPTLCTARLALLPRDTPLCVRLCCTGGSQGWIAPPEFDPLEPALWEYYFGQRRIDWLRLEISPDLPLRAVIHVAGLLARHLASGAMAIVRAQASAAPGRFATRWQQALRRHGFIARGLDPRTVFASVSIS